MSEEPDLTSIFKLYLLKVKPTYSPDPFNPSSFIRVMAIKIKSRLNGNYFRQPLKCSPLLHRHRIIRSYKVKYQRTESTETFNYVCTTLFTLSFHFEMTKVANCNNAFSRCYMTSWNNGNVLCWNKSYAMACIS